MRILSRIVMVLALLCGLAYGSYVVGNRVVSKKMFGDVVKPRSGSGLTVSGKTTVRKAPDNGQGVQVQVLPAQDDAPSLNRSGSDTTFSGLQPATTGRATKSRTPRGEKLVRADALPTPGLKLGGRLDDGSDTSLPDDTSRRRRRRRRRRNADDNSASRRRAGSENGASLRDNSSGDSGGTSRSSSSNASPPRERPSNHERATSHSSGNDSPVPRAESSGDSPVPQPE